MILEKIVSKYVRDLTIKYLPKKMYNTIGQSVSILYLLNKLQIYSDPGNIVYSGYLNVYVNRKANRSMDLPVSAIFNDLSKEKHIVVDLSLLYLHSKKEINRLKLQLQESLKVARNYLFDTNLVFISNSDVDVSNLIQGKNLVRFTNKTSFLEKFKSEILYLDPYSDRSLTISDIDRFKYFVVGGIVDKNVEIKYSTQSLYEGFNIESRKIEIFGSINGVPDRVNRLADIIFRTHYLTRDLEKSIILNMTKRDLYNLLLKNKNICMYDELLALLIKHHRTTIYKILKTHKNYIKSFNCFSKYIDYEANQSEDHLS